MGEPFYEESDHKQDQGQYKCDGRSFINVMVQDVHLCEKA